MIGHGSDQRSLDPLPYGESMEKWLEEHVDAIDSKRSSLGETRTPSSYRIMILLATMRDYNVPIYRIDPPTAAAADEMHRNAIASPSASCSSSSSLARRGVIFSSQQEATLTIDTTTVGA